jgi:hypothetical protein
LRVGARQEEVERALDESLVVGGEGGARELLFQAIGNPAAVELVLELAVSLVIQNAVGHGGSPPAL